MPFPLGHTFVGVRVGLFSPFDCIGAPHPAGEHAVQREGKDILVSLCCAGWEILDSRRANCGFMRDAGKGGSGTICWKLHRWRVMTAGQGDVHLETSARYHLYC